MLAGEWGILEPGNSCIVMAIDQYMTATISNMEHPHANTLILHLPDLGIPTIAATYQHEALIIQTPLTPAQEQQATLCLQAVAMALRWLDAEQKPITPFALTLNSDISGITTATGTPTKIGFGSSAATVVATIKAIMAFHRYTLTTPETKEIIFKLAVLAHYRAQGNCGSGFDIAAATYETTVLYTRFDQAWVQKMQTNASTSLTTLITTPWPNLQIAPIKIPANLFILIGFSGTSANTPALIAAMNNYKKNNLQHYTSSTTAINNTVLKLVQALNKSNTPQIFAAITCNHELLAALAQEANITLITPALNTLINIAQQQGAAAKFSGAGGGDCGIALCTDNATADTITHAWRHAGIIPLAVTIL